MTVAMPGRRESKQSKESAACSFPLTTAAAAALPVHDVLDRLESGLEGLPETEARRRLVTAGPNAVRSHRARAWPVLAALAVVTAGAVLPATPFGRMLGFRPLPGPFFLALVLMVVAYLLLIELGKYWFYRSYRAPAAAAPRPAVPARRRRVHRRAARFTTG